MAKKSVRNVTVPGTPSAPDQSAPTINTVCGPIFAGTPQAAIYLELEGLKGPLQKFTDAFRAMDLNKREAIAEIDKLLPIVPAAQSGVSETLEQLRASLESGAPNGNSVSALDGHLSRIDMGMSLTANTAPCPRRPGTVDPKPGQPLGSGLATKF